jgi:hypothetical protein
MKNANESLCKNSTERHFTLVIVDKGNVMDIDGYNSARPHA